VHWSKESKRGIKKRALTSAFFNQYTFLKKSDDLIAKSLSYPQEKIQSWIDEMTMNAFFKKSKRPAANKAAGFFVHEIRRS
jgi:hypothetical protein